MGKYEYEMLIVSDRSLCIDFKGRSLNQRSAIALEYSALLKEKNYIWVEAFKVLGSSVTVIYNPTLCTYKKASSALSRLVRAVKITEPDGKRRVHCIPACYCGEYAPDVLNTARELGITEEELIKLHTSRDNLVLGGALAGELWLSPAEDSRRITVPEKTAVKGSIVFDGVHSYITSSDRVCDKPVIGRTYVDTFDFEKGEFLIKEGEYIRFVSVGENKFKKLADKGEYEIQLRKAGGTDADKNS